MEKEEDAKIDWDLVAKERRAKVLWISRRKLFHALIVSSQDATQIIRVSLPKQYRVRDVHYEFSRDSFGFVIESPDFPMNVAGAELLSMELEFQEVMIPLTTKHPLDKDGMIAWKKAIKGIEKDQGGQQEETNPDTIDRMPRDLGIITHTTLENHNKCADKINEIIDLLNTQNADITKAKNSLANINDEVTVELTEHGKNVASEHYRKQHVPSLAVYRRVRNDIYRFPLWELMSIFGAHTYMGAKQVFLHNRIIFGEKE